MRRVPSLKLLRTELEQEMLLLLHGNGGSELFWKDKPLWTAKVCKCDIVETKAAGERHHERGYLNISVTKNGLNCFPKWALAEQRESLWFQGFLKYFWNETLWMFCGCWSLECSVVLELRVHTIKALSTLLKASSNTLKQAQEAVFMFSGWL